MRVPDDHPFVIAPALLGMVRPIDAFKPWPNNARLGDVGEIAGSLKDFGQTKPAVVQASTGLICAGNHLRLAAKSLGGTLLAYNVMDLTDAQAHAYYLRDNRTSDLASYDEVQLAADVRQAFEGGYGDSTGYSGDDLDDLLRGTGELTLEEKPHHRDQEGFLDRFLNTTIRQLSMHFNSEDYEAVIARLDRAMAVSQSPSHTDTLLYLLDEWEKAQGEDLPPLGGADEEFAANDGVTEDDDDAASEDEA